MAFGSAITVKTVFGNKRFHAGTFSCASVAGGDVNTGLRSCETMNLTLQGSAVASTAPAVNESLPVAGSAVTIVTPSSAAGYWEATGY
ncbi:MAG: hypothetical protein ACYSW3_00245 [Planctomycetota bacterium]|jgi:hypothetical protein